MQIDFSVGGTPAKFRRNHFTGKAPLSVGGDRQTLQSGFRPHSYTVLVDEQIVAEEKGYWSLPGAWLPIAEARLPLDRLESVPVHCRNRA